VEQGSGCDNLGILCSLSDLPNIHANSTLSSFMFIWLPAPGHPVSAVILVLLRLSLFQQPPACLIFCLSSFLISYY